MATAAIDDRGRGPEIRGTRITVYHLLPHLLDPTVTEAEIGRIYDLAPEQVAAARAYILSHPEGVLARHLEIEARMAEGNPPEVVEQARRARESFRKFRSWLAGRGRDGPAGPEIEAAAPGRGPTFREWLAESGDRAGNG